MKHHTRPGFALPVSIALLCMLLAACGEPPPSARAERKKAGGIWKRALRPGKDENSKLEDGKTWRKSVLTRSYDLPSNVFAWHAEPFRVTPFNKDEAVWITKWKSTTENEDGTRAPDDIHCHAFFCTRPLRARDSHIFDGVALDGFTPSFTFPTGFGLRIDAGAKMVFEPMFNNRRPDPRRARMRLDLDYLPEHAVPKGSMRVLHVFTASSARPDTYWVPKREAGMPPYRDVRVREAIIPATGRVHAMGAHLHPFGRSVEFKRKRDGKIMFTARMIEAEHLEDQRVTTYSSTTGFYMKQGERYLITTIVENPSEVAVDAMGGFYVFYDPEGKPDA